MAGAPEIFVASNAQRRFVTVLLRKLIGLIEERCARERTPTERLIMRRMICLEIKHLFRQEAIEPALNPQQDFTLSEWN